MEKYSYCGPSKLPKFLRSLMSDKFNGACKIHDDDYSTGQVGRKEADKKFFQNMLSVSKSFRDKILAWIYYKAVRVFGSRFFRR